MAREMRRRTLLLEIPASFLGLFSRLLGGNGESVGTLGIVRPGKEGGNMGGNEDEDGEHKGDLVKTVLR
jgi:hypothetical protein